MTEMKQEWSEDGLHVSFARMYVDPALVAARAPESSASILPQARGSFAGGHVAVDMANPGVVTELVFEDEEAFDEQLGHLVVQSEDGFGVSASSRLSDLAALAEATWWLHWCPQQVPHGVFLADVGVAQWRVGLRRAAFDALSDGGAMTITSWLAEAADAALPSRLVSALRDAAQDASEALGPRQSSALALRDVLELWTTTGSVPADVPSFADLWRQWDEREVSAGSQIAISLGPPTPWRVGGLFFVAALASTGGSTDGSAQMPEELRLPAASVDWHAVPPRVLMAGEWTVSAIVDMTQRRILISVDAVSVGAAASAQGLIAQLVHKRTGEPLTAPMLLLATPGERTLQAEGQLADDITSAVMASAEPHVLHVTYSGTVRVGQAAAAARAQRHAIRAFVALRTSAARDWLGLKPKNELRQEARRALSEATRALREAYPDDTPPDLGHFEGLDFQVGPERDDAPLLGLSVEVPPPSLPALFLAMALER